MVLGCQTATNAEQLTSSPVVAFWLAVLAVPSVAQELLAVSRCWLPQLVFWVQHSDSAWKPLRRLCSDPSSVLLCSSHPPSSGQTRTRCRRGRRKSSLAGRVSSMQH